VAKTNTMGIHAHCAFAPRVPRTDVLLMSSIAVFTQAKDDALPHDSELNCLHFTTQVPSYYPEATRLRLPSLAA
jgi:hypothetical protein